MLPFAQIRSVLFIACAIVLAPLWGVAAAAADADIVGSVAMLVDPAVAKQLNLSVTQRQNFASLVNRRESDALEFASLAPQEQATKLAELRRRTEQEALADLTEIQRAAFAKIRLGRSGLESLADEQLAAQLGLDAEQKKKVAALLAERGQRLDSAAATDRQAIQAQFDQQLVAVLSPEQKLAWEKLAGVPVPAGTAPAAAPPPLAADAKPSVAEKPKAAAPQTPPDDRKITDLDAKTPAAKDGPSRSYGPRKGFGGPRKSGEGKFSATKPGEGKVAGDTAKQRPKPTGLEPPAKSHDGLIQFSFRNQPWGEVLDWFAAQAGLSLMMDTPPPGVFNYTDPKRYTPEKAIDLLNSVLLMKGMILIRNEQMLMLVRTDEIPSILVPVVSPEDLDKKGEHELVRVVFPLQNATPEEIQQEIRPLVGKQGSVEILTKSRQIQVTETAGHLRAIRKVIDSIENPPPSQQVHTIELEHATADQVLGPLRTFLGLPPDGFAAIDGSIRMMVEPVSGKLLVTGRTEKINQLRELVKKLDQPSRVTESDGVIETPQLEVYAISTADPTMVLAVLQTMMAGQPDIRLDKDAKTGSVVAWARPSQHRAIKAMINELQKDAKQVEVIRLKKVDPQLAVLAIQKLFGGADAGGAQAPVVDAEPTTRQLLIRATSGQIEQIRAMLRKMGEQESTDERLAADKSKIRVLPLSGRQARSVLEQAEALWPVQGANKIRVVTPSSPGGVPGASTLPRGTSAEGASSAAPAAGSSQFSREFIEQLRERLPRREGEPPARSPDASPPPREKSAPDPLDRRTDVGPAVPAINRVARQQPTIQLVAVPAEVRLAQADVNENAPPRGEAPKVAPPKAPAAKPAETKPGAKKEPAPIIVTVTPGGIVITSEDTKALDDFEELVNTLSSTSGSSGREFTVFYLKHAKAEVAEELLNDVFGGGSSSSGGGGSLLGDLAGAALGGSGGSLVSSLLGGGGGSAAGFATGLVDIVADPRLNALIVQANSNDLDTVEQLLKVVDQPSSPETVFVPAKPRFIQVYNNQAEDIAQVVRQVYSEHITAVGAAGMNQMRQPSPEDFIRMLRGGGDRGGGRGRGRGGRNQDRQEIDKMTVSVDANSNSLIVAAPENLFQQVKGLVEELDRTQSESRQATSVVTLRRASPIVVQQALTGLLGDKVKSNTLSSSTPGTGRTSSTSPTSQAGGMQQGQPFGGPFGQQGGDGEERMRRFMEFRDAMRQQGGGGRDGGRDEGRREFRGRDGGGDRGGRGGRD
jgi:type II secretory pathway component GspD/PulD (secretin)